MVYILSLCTRYSIGYFLAGHHGPGHGPPDRQTPPLAWHIFFCTGTACIWFFCLCFPLQTNKKPPHNMTATLKTYYHISRIIFINRIPSFTPSSYRYSWHIPFPSSMSSIQSSMASLCSLVISFIQWSIRSFSLWSAFFSSWVLSYCHRVTSHSTLAAMTSSHCSLVVFFIDTPPSANTISNIPAEVHIHMS